MSGENKTYCGDGLYASFDGYQLAIAVNDHRNEPVGYMERQVFESFVHFGLRMFGLKAEIRSAEEASEQTET